jgi:acyl-coenzyme A thioesterase PaaI-like protein
VIDLTKLVPPAISELLPEAGWTPIEMPFSSSGGASFVEGDPEGRRLRIRQFVRESDKRLFAKVWFGPQAEGPPGHAHGGSMAAVLDHTMGISAWVAGYPVLAATITINFHAKLRLGTVAISECWVERVDGRKVYTSGRLYTDNPEKSVATGQGLFILQEIETFKGLLTKDATVTENMERAQANMRR